MSPTAGYLVETLVTLVVVCGLAFVVLYGARRLGIGRPRGPISLVGQLPLEGRRAIYLVRVAEQVIVVGASEGGFTKLAEMPAEGFPFAPDPPAFSAVLSRVLSKKQEEKP